MSPACSAQTRPPPNPFRQPIFSDLRPTTRDTTDSSIAKIVQIQNDEGPPSAERFEHCERQTGEACMERVGACRKRFWKTGMRDRTELPTRA